MVLHGIYCFAWYFIDYTVLIWRAGELPRSASSHFIIYLEVPVSRNLTLVVSADFWKADNAYVAFSKLKENQKK